jgi:hypothetical protein
MSKKRPVAASAERGSTSPSAIRKGRSAVSVSGGLRVRSYEVLRHAVELGVDFGWRRAYRYSQTPPPDDAEAERVREAIAEAVVGECCEWFQFEEQKC